LVAGEGNDPSPNWLMRPASHLVNPQLKLYCSWFFVACQLLLFFVVAGGDPGFPVSRIRGSAFTLHLASTFYFAPFDLRQGGASKVAAVRITTSHSPLKGKFGQFLTWLKNLLTIILQDFHLFVKASNLDLLVCGFASPIVPQSIVTSFLKS